MERVRCAGCRAAPGPICPECKDLTVGEVVATRWRWPPWAALAVVPLLLLLAWLGWSAPVAGYRVVGVVVLVPATLAWAVRRMKAPHRLKLVRDRLEITSQIGGTRRVPIAEVLSDKGTVVLARERRRIVVGAARYDGAETFHRALRARRATLGLDPE